MVRNLQGNNMLWRPKTLEKKPGKLQKGVDKRGMVWYISKAPAGRQGFLSRKPDGEKRKKYLTNACGCDKINEFAEAKSFG